MDHEPVTVFLPPDYDRIVLPEADGTGMAILRMRDLMLRRRASGSNIVHVIDLEDQSQVVMYGSDAQRPEVVVSQSRVGPNRYEWAIVRRRFIDSSVGTHGLGSRFDRRTLHSFEQLLLAMAYVDHRMMSCSTSRSSAGTIPFASACLDGLAGAPYASVVVPKGGDHG